MSNYKKRAAINLKGKVWEFFLGLPTNDKRNIPENRIVRFFLPPLFSANSDDTYIYYLCAKSGFFLTLGVISLHLLIAILDVSLPFYPFDVFIDHQRYFESFSVNVAKVSARLISILVIPFYVLKILYNFNPKSVDVLWWYKQLSIVKKTSVSAVVPRFLILTIILWASIFHVSSAAFFVINPQTSESMHMQTQIFLTVVPIIIYLFSYSFFPMFIVFSLVVLYRYIGNFTQRSNSNWIINGEQND